MNGSFYEPRLVVSLRTSSSNIDRTPSSFFISPLFTARTPRERANFSPFFFASLPADRLLAAAEEFALQTSRDL